MQYCLTNFPKSWTVEGPKKDQPEGIEIQYSECWVFTLGRVTPTNRKAIESFENFLKTTKAPWLHPGAKEWVLDLDLLRKTFPEFNALTWLRGKISVEPLAETYENDESLRFRLEDERRRRMEPKDFYVAPQVAYESKVYIVVTRDSVESLAQSLGVPNEVRKSLKRFNEEFPDPGKASFLMMAFRETLDDNTIVETVRKTLEPYGIAAIRADEKHYHSDLLQNTLTLIHGCGFGIALFEGNEQETYNPNVSFEVGYMMALGKPIFILKDKKLKSLHADLMGQLYCEFRPDDPASVSVKLNEWLRDKYLVLKPQVEQV